MSNNFDLSGIIETYRYLHTIPEPAFEEYKTSEYIFDFLKKINLSPKRCAKTGVYADICGKNTDNSKMILIRADIDALPIIEDSGVEFCSKNNGYMHACGHDMHTACLLHVAKALSQNKDAFSGTVRVVFQPAEEGIGGAKPMIDEGVLEDVTAGLCMHVDPLADAGTVLYKDGSITASPDDYKLIIKGKGGHAAEPDKCINPVVIASEIIKEYSTLIENHFKGKECVTTVCTCHGGSFNNIIPDTVEITGTVRSFDNNTRYEVKSKLEEIAKQICTYHMAKYEFIYNELYPSTINSHKINEILKFAAENTNGIKSIVELKNGSMTGDDFAYFAQAVPSSYFRFGVGVAGERYPLHSSKFKIDETSLLVGCELIFNTVLKYFN